MMESNLTQESPKSQFDIGDFWIEPGVREEISETEILEALKRHIQMDFGDRTADEQFENFVAITNARGRARSDYFSPRGKRFFIETDFDEQYTRVACPND